jgi:nucleoside-diphosphate-sugar epimerase
MHLPRNKKTIHELKIGEYKFEGISRFTYLGSVLTENNSIIAEISERIKKGNATYYKNRKLLTSKLLTRNIKLRLYLTLIRPFLTYGPETWTETESELQKLLIFERKILRKIYGQVKDRNN